MTPSEAPKALQTSECSELLDLMRASCLISAQHQPGKFTRLGCSGALALGCWCLQLAGPSAGCRFEWLWVRVWFRVWLLGLRV